jgi:hypothetical protein
MEIYKPSRVLIFDDPPERDDDQDDDLKTGRGGQINIYETKKWFLEAFRL